MSTLKPVKYCRFIVILCKCGKELTKALFEKRVKDSTPKDYNPFPWTVDQFLDSNEEEIRDHKLDIRTKNELFHTKPRRLNEWDVSMFCFLLKVFEVDQDVLDNVNWLRLLRNEIAHKSEPNLSDKDYEENLGKIKSVIDKCTKKIGRTDLKDELYKCIDQAEKICTTDANDVKEEEKILKKWENLEQCLNMYSKDIPKFRNRLEDLIMLFEEKGVSTDIVIELVIRICVVGEPGDKDVLKSVIAKHVDMSVFNEQIESMEKVFRSGGNEVERRTINSILFNLTCPSVTSLMGALDYLTGTLLARRLHRMKLALEDLVGNIVDLEIQIPEKIRENILKILKEELASGQGYKKRKLHGKVFNDPIHGQIELHPVCLKVVDTPQFQRLRHIKQLDTCYLVYPGAMHSRFEHSIGVCHLAGKLLRALKERQPELNITTKDILCVEIAALCHDLGQGPFSHVFEEKFIPAQNTGIDWKHEEASLKMFNYMLRDNGDSLKNYFTRFITGFGENDITFIEEMIGVPRDVKAEDWPYKGRSKEKSFLYEIVANGENGIDVDKWDYLARDSAMLGMKTNFDHDRCIFSARVIMADGRKQICYREKSSQDLYDMFYTRMTLHRRAYQHKTHSIIGTMIRDVLLAADDHFFLDGENGTRLRLSETINDMKAYTYVTDDILQEIMRSTDKDLEPAREIISRIQNRQFYKCVTQTQVDVKNKGWFKKTEVQENLFNKILQRKPDIEDLEKAVEIDVVSVDFGRKDEDPVSKVWFYGKWDEDKAIRISKEQVSYVLPDTFAEQYVRVYSSVGDTELHDAIDKSFSEWCKENELPQPKGYLSQTA